MAIKKILTLSSNQYYKGLNNRYDNRVKKLKKLGFSLNREYMQWYKKYFTIPDFKNGRVMSNEFVYHSDNRSFLDRIKTFNP